MPSAFFTPLPDPDVFEHEHIENKTEKTINNAINLRDLFILTPKDNKTVSYKKIITDSL